MFFEMVVVVGAGSIGVRHAEVLRESGHHVLLFPKRVERMEQLSAQGWNCVDSLQSAVESGAKFAIVASDTGRHVSDTVTALELGFSRVLV